MDALLEQCRTRFADTLAAALAECGLRLPAVQEVIRREAASAFRELAGLHSKEEYQRLRSVTASRISLVHPEDMDLTVALINLSHALGDACERELPRLHLLFMRLLGQDSSVLDQLPVGPDAVCVALRGVCDSGEIAPELRLELPDLVRPYLSVLLRELYSGLTETLQAAGVEPVSLLRSGQDAGGSGYQPLQERVPLASGDGKGYGGPGSESLNIGRTLDGPLGQLQERLLRNRQSGAAASAPTLDPALLAAIMERVFIWLTERQQAAADAAPGSLAELQALLPAASNATLDAINLSFDVLCADARLCPPVRASLARLRLPVAKAALIEGEVLGQADGVVSRFLEALLRLGYALAPDAAAADPLCSAIDAAVLRIQREFERDPAVFAREAALLGEHEAALLARQAEACAAFQPALQQEAQREHSRNRAARAVRALCAGDLPRPVRVFLERLWVRVLAAIHQHGGGEKSPAWLRALRTANQLVESVQPRSDAASRDALLAGLPGLLAELRAGLDAIGTPEALRERAFQSFASLHALAMQGRESGPSLGDDILKATPPRLEAASQQPGLQWVRLAPETDSPPPEWIAQLAADHWLDLCLPGEAGSLRLRICACEGSPRMYLACTLDATRCLVIPQRWLQQAEARAQALPAGALFEQAAETALRAGAGYH
ncbi:DUF1631 family protein [Uliginosibacterium sp. 31-12]|uniref:DUF1631 family protein n=1 Tax=Uliginosibacterium sp. 31-12 TaxID=3062781 RepID=UPI0026E309CD|nr:DUF1631 family protein [Uliginosibacterium sp. 31-12]MDO6386470.1 DUF1631 family protein [Uliginosibacterium sp. 31-12]